MARVELPSPDAEEEEHAAHDDGRQEHEEEHHDPRRRPSLPRFEYRRILFHAARKVLATEHEAKHLSAHDFRHAALTHKAAVGSDLTAIGHVAGHKNATTTALYVHNSEAAARRAVARRAGILDTKVDTDAGQAAEKRPVARLKSSESFGGPNLEPMD